MKADVGVVGAGPAGLLAANALVQAGVECAVFERLSEDATRARTRAGQIDARTVALLERHELADGLHARGLTSEACEFRRGGVRHVFDYAALTGFWHHFYPQQLLVADMIDALRGRGGEVTFGCAVAEILVSERPVIVLANGGEVSCDFVLGCDGFHGVSRHALKGAACSGVDFGAALLAFLAEVPPSSDHGVYGLHPDGFAGHMLRSPTTSRFYLQVEPATDANRLSDEWIWNEITPRLTANGIELVPGRILERGIVELHSYVTEPMHHGPLFLAGDAAHIVTPAGGKGMNLALQDADELVAGLLDHYRTETTAGSRPTAARAFPPSGAPSNSRTGCSTCCWRTRAKDGSARDCATPGSHGSCPAGDSLKSSQSTTSDRRTPAAKPRPAG